MIKEFTVRSIVTIVGIRIEFGSWLVAVFRIQ